MNEFITTESVPLSKPFEIEISGMTKRDWFAGMALCGMWAHHHSDTTYDQDAHAAYRAADAMMKARKGEKDE